MLKTVAFVFLKVLNFYQIQKPQITSNCNNIINYFQNEDRDNKKNQLYSI